MGCMFTAPDAVLGLKGMEKQKRAHNKQARHARPISLYSQLDMKVSLLVNQ